VDGAEGGEISAQAKRGKKNIEVISCLIKKEEACSQKQASNQGMEALSAWEGEAA